MLELTDVSTGYGDSQILFDIDLRIEEGEFVAMLGPNGAGKTTLLRAISGTLDLYDGEITYRGEQINGQRPDELARQGIIHVPQDESLFDELSVIDNLRAGSFMKNVRDSRDDNLDMVFDIFPRLDERKSQIAGTLSGGERKMLAVSKGLMAKPDLLLLDEPSAGLAPNLVDLVFDRIDQIHDQLGTTVFLVEQRVIESLDVADRAYVLENGRIQMRDTTDELKKNPEIQESYLGL